MRSRWPRAPCSHWRPRSRCWLLLVCGSQSRTRRERSCGGTARRLFGMATTQVAGRTAAAELATFCAQLRWEELDDAVRARTIELVLDLLDRKSTRLNS